MMVVVAAALGALLLLLLVPLSASGMVICSQVLHGREATSAPPCRTHKAVGMWKLAV
jgi:hypothetical protein